MWRIKVAGLAAGFTITCAAYYKVFALEMLSARAVQKRRYEDIEQRLLAAERDAIKVAPAELNAAAQATAPPSSE
ncbi:unspecified product [Leishmania tarentolae]|uniref:Unspecified product n=1 Tax=Leishmania tarentolae TaxID=5689 RepID=A0A640KPC6_LEITA|nr:unspecified product [Leishmania tarentolae]